MKKSPLKAVTVGKLTDWPLGARLAKLLDLPASVTELGCVQVVGSHGPAVAEVLAKVPEKPSAAAKSARKSMLAALETCTSNRSATFKSHVAFHASLSAEDLRARLAQSFLVRSPAEALLARKKTPAQSLKAIEKALAGLSGLGAARQRVTAFLEGSGKIEPLQDIDAGVLRGAIVSEPEVYNEVDERLFSLWVHAASHMTTFPQVHPGDPELGFDRRGIYLDKLVAAGMARAAAEDMMMSRWAQYARMWPSTGVWVWEQLVSNAKGLSERVLGLEDGARNLEHVLTSMLELRDGAHEAGALDVLRKFCAKAPLVPDKTMEKLLASYRPLLASVKREGTSAPFKDYTRGIVTAIPLRSC